MDTDNQPNQENPESPAAASDEQVTSASQTRSYECTFCKRGFSNAQALGGHMNIHRKDKARLKQLTTNTEHQTQASSFSPTHTTVEAKSGEDKSTSIKWPNWAVDHTDTDDHVTKSMKHIMNVKEIQQLPLFVDNPSSNKDQKTSSIDQIDHGSSEKGLSSSSSELDLELRLGPEPQDSSPTATGTKKFF